MTSEAFVAAAHDLIDHCMHTNLLAWPVYKPTPTLLVLKDYDKNSRLVSECIYGTSFISC